MYIEGHDNKVDDEEGTLCFQAWNIEYDYQFEEWVKMTSHDFPEIELWIAFDGNIPEFRKRKEKVNSYIGLWKRKEGNEGLPELVKRGMNLENKVKYPDKEGWK